jgi:outer membrane protein insertion porin family
VDTLTKLLAFLVVLGTLVVFHELGHYVVARWCKVKVLRFSIGFGRVVWARRFGADRTEWAVSAIPLGGYVKMLDEREGAVAADDLPRAFNRQSVGKRIAIVAAGPIANLLLACSSSRGPSSQGVPGQRALACDATREHAGGCGGDSRRGPGRRRRRRPVKSWQDLRWRLLRASGASEITIDVERPDGAHAQRTVSLGSVTGAEWEGNFMPTLGFRTDLGAPLIDEALPDKPAARAGIRAGDRIVAIDGEPVRSPAEVAAKTNARPGSAVTFRIVRDGAERDVTFTTEVAEQAGRKVGIAGVRLKVDPVYAERLSITVRYGLGDALVQGTRKTWELAAFTVRMLGRILIGEASLKNISGPITMADFAGSPRKRERSSSSAISRSSASASACSISSLFRCWMGGICCIISSKSSKAAPSPTALSRSANASAWPCWPCSWRWLFSMTSPDCSSHVPLPVPRPPIVLTSVVGKRGSGDCGNSDAQLRRAVLAALAHLRNALTAGCRAGIAALALAFALAWVAPPASAITPFVVKDIRVEGVQRTEAGTVFSYLPIKVGDTLDDEKAALAVKALFATGFFRDVRLEVEDQVLLVIVQERPTISKVEITGNKEFDTDTLKKALKEIGVADARIFDRSALDRAEQEMKRQYLSRGRYAAKVTVTVTPQERNRVAINIAIEEGDAAKIARINIVGENAYSESDLLSMMTLTTPGWTTWYTKNDQYSKQKLSADLETLRSYYQNRGYLEFNVDSTQVSITPDKEDIYITINITEGPRYTVSEIRLGGDLPIPATELAGLVQMRVGETFSRERLQASVKAISDRLGTEGYAFANVNAIPEIDRDKLSAAFTIFVDPGRRVYIRKVNINGNVRTRDEVIRREMRQLEAAWYDGARIERSKVRIRRLGYFDDVNIETPPVAGTPDQADVEVTVTEKATGNLLAGIGYSTSEKFVFNASVSQQNIFGSGNALTAGINTSSINRTIAVTYTEPYYTVDGVSRTLEAYQRQIDPSTLSVAPYQSETIGGAVSYGIPITETDTINLGFRYDHNKLTLFENSPLYYFLYVAEFGSVTDSIIVSLGWARDTRDDILYPTRGVLQVAGVEVGVPIVDLSYYKANYLIQWFWPFYGDFVLMLRGDVGYAAGYGGKPLPFYKVFYGGGVGSVRGYDTATLVRATLPEILWAGSARSSAMPSCSIRSSGETNRCGQACSSMPVRFPGFQAWARRVRASRRKTRSSVFRTASGSRGTRRWGRSSSATRFRSRSTAATGSRPSSSRSGRCSRRRYEVRRRDD